MRKSLAVVSLIGVFACVPAAHADVLGTEGGFTYTKATEVMPKEAGYSVATVGAKCPKGTLPVGGGGAISSNPFASAIAGSYPNRRKWAAEMWNLAQSSKARATAYAVCSKQESKISTVPSASSLSGTGAHLPPPAECVDADSSLTSGGFSVVDPTHWTGHGSYPTDGPDADPDADDAWTNVVQHKVAQEEDLVTYVVCFEGGDLQYVNQFTNGSDPVTDKVFCPGGTSVAGGGFTATGDAESDSYPVISKPLDSKDDKGRIPDDGWLVRMSDPTFDIIAPTVYANCM